MSRPYFDLTGFADLRANTSVDVFPEQRAELRVSHRGTMQINYAIAYCWLHTIPFALTASIDSTEEEIVASVDLTRPLLSNFEGAEQEMYLRWLSNSLAEWVHEKFFNILRQHRYIFEEAKQ